MTETICRMYPRLDIATAAADAVKRSGLQASLVHIVAPEDAADLPTDDVVKAVASVGIPKSQATKLAPGISRGEALVVVHAPFTAAGAAITELSKFQPIPSGLPEPAPAPSWAWDEDAPLSSALRIPTRYLNAAPFSQFWNIPLLIKSKAGELENMEFISFLSRKANLFSGIFNAKMLAGSGTLFSDMFGMSAISKSATPLSSWFHIPVLIKQDKDR